MVALKCPQDSCNNAIRKECIRWFFLLLLVIDFTGAFNIGLRVASTRRSKNAPAVRGDWVYGSALNMFTGIVEEIGEVVSLQERDDMVLWDGSNGTGAELVVKADVVLQDAYLGCSISVCGVCLTATALDADKKTFTVGLAPETLRKSYFGMHAGPHTLRAGDSVNLERASEIGGRNSGHFVQGHVDGTGIIVDRWQEKDSLWTKIQLSDEYKNLIKYIVPKGFIAIDGTSLTVVDVDVEKSWFTLMLVEYTQKKIILPSKPIGGLVNLEVDVLGKYSEQALAALIPRLEALEAKVTFLEKQMLRISTDTHTVTQ